MERTYDPKNVVVKLGDTVITGVKFIDYVYELGAVPYPVLETAEHPGRVVLFSPVSGTSLPIATGSNLDRIGSLLGVSRDEGETDFDLRVRCLQTFGHTPDLQQLPPPLALRVTGRRVPPKDLDPRPDAGMAGAVAACDLMKGEGANLSRDEDFQVARDAALQHGIIMEVISNGQAEADRLSSATTPAPLWRKEGDQQAKCGGLRFVHPNQGGPLSAWHLTLIARLWVGKPLYTRRLQSGAVSPKVRVWEPKHHDLFGRRPFSEKIPLDDKGPYAVSRCAAPYCTSPRIMDSRFCLVHHDEGDQEW